MTTKTRTEDALDSLEKMLKGNGFVVERDPEIRDANGDLHRVDLKGELDSSGLFKNIVLYRGVEQNVSLETAKDMICQAGNVYRAKAGCSTALHCILIFEDRARYSTKELSKLDNCGGFSYKFADDICRELAEVSNGRTSRG